MKLVHPVLQKHGLVLIQGGCEAPQGYVGVLTQIVDGITGRLLVNSELQVPCDVRKINKEGQETFESNAQKGIGAVTYGRRTGITSALAIAEEDDDGNEASSADAPQRAEAGGKTDKKALW